MYIQCIHTTRKKQPEIKQRNLVQDIPDLFLFKYNFKIFLLSSYPKPLQHTFLGSLKDLEALGLLQLFIIY